MNKETKTEKLSRELGLLKEDPIQRESWEGELDDILLDYCDKQDCKALEDHAGLKSVVRDRLYRILSRTREQVYREGVKDGESKTRNGVGRYQLGYHDGREQVLQEVEERMPEEKTKKDVPDISGSPSLNEIVEYAKALGYNAYRTDMLTTIHQMRGTKE